MTDRVHYHPDLIYSPGSRVVTLVDVPGAGGVVAQPRGTVGVVVKSPTDLDHSYRVRFPDGAEHPLKRDEVILLAFHKKGALHEIAPEAELTDRIIYRCVIGSQAYGLSHDQSDVDRRGIFLPPAERHWSLYGVPEQIENDATQEAYWELQKFLVLALKANPNILECLYTPLVEKATPLARDGSPTPTSRSTAASTSGCGAIWRPPTSGAPCRKRPTPARRCMTCWCACV